MTARHNPPIATRLAEDLDTAFAQLVADEERAVYSAALRITGNSEVALDLAAETFTRSYAALRRFDRGRLETLQIRPWLMAILLNCWRNELRTRSRRPVTTPFEQGNEPISGSEGTETAVLRRETAGELALALDNLPERERAAVVLRHVVGLSYGEVASSLGCPAGTAKSHVHRGLHRLRECLDAAKGGVHDR